jgi:FkbM family methyltransferase
MELGNAAWGQGICDRVLRRAGGMLERAGRRLRRVGGRREVWLDVGAHLGEWTFPCAAGDPTLLVYAFEPNLAVAARRIGVLPNFVVLPMAVAEQDGCATFYLNTFAAASSLLPLNPEGVKRWIGGESLRVERQLAIPTIRLDTFLNRMELGRVDYLKIDAQGGDLSVVRSAGDRLRDIRKIALEVQTTEIPLYSGAAGRTEVVAYLERAGFVLAGSECQNHQQEENLTFVNRTLA